MVHVRFLPDNVTVEVERGATVLAAAQKCGVYINSICGGDGICGKCRVILHSGEIDPEPTKLLTRREIRSDYILACLSRVKSDVVIEDKILTPRLQQLSATLQSRLISLTP